MAATTEIVCPVCGARNAPNLQRCTSCGAKIEALNVELTDDELYARRHQQETFEWKWTFIALGVYLTLQFIALVALRFVIPTYDPEGLYGLLVSCAVWFIGGIVVGVYSPGKTFVEPAVGALIAVIPTVAYLISITDVYKLSILAYVVGGLMGVMITLFGSFLGEKIQMATGKQART
jgi:cation transport ATPase